MARRLKNFFYLLSFIGTGYGAMVLIRHSMGSKEYKSDVTLYGKTAIVTGANTGIGKEVAKDLSKRGARVIMACRDMDKCLKAKEEIISETFNKKMECVECDLASLESIKRFTETIKKNEKFVHILVNNAGVMWCPRTLTKEGFETQLGVNFLGHFYLTYLLLDLLKLSAPSRIVNVTCKSYKIGKINFNDLNSAQKYDEREAYNQSKLANVMHTCELSELLKESKVTVNTVDPGKASTDILRHTSLYNSKYSSKIAGPLTDMFINTPTAAAQTVNYCCSAPELENVTGKYFCDLAEIPIAENALNKEDSKRLWLIAKKWTRLS